MPRGGSRRTSTPGRYTCSTSSPRGRPARSSRPSCAPAEPASRPASQPAPRREERVMDLMSVTDAGFYYAEGGTTPMHVGSVTVFDGPAPSYGDLVRLLLGKLPQVPRYHQRVRTVPFSLGRPVWVDDEHFQILYHVRHTAVPRPGGPEQLRNLAGR